MEHILINTPDWISIVEANVPPGAEYWHLKSVEYWDDQRSGGTHHIYTGEPHDPSVRMEVSNEQETWHVPLDKPANEPAANFAMWGGNRYSAKLEGTSDVIEGMHMPGNHHVSFVLCWERTIKGADREASGDLDSLENKLIDAAKDFSFPLYKDAALFKKMQADGFMPCSPEFTVAYRGETWIAQVGKNLDTDEEMIAFVLNGDWDNVRSMPF